MESHTFKCVTFGGFDKQDVAEYIERTSREFAEQQTRLEQERDSLQARTEELEKQVAALRLQAEAQSDRLTELQSALADAEQRADGARDQQARLEELTAQVESLRPDAESYRQFRNRIGDIECEARSRAAELENATRARLREVTDRFREQYQALAASFDTASAYVTGELRKVEVNLTQLPRALDQIGAELEQLDGTLSDGEQ